MKFDYKKLRVKLSSRSYSIYIGPGILGRTDLWLPEKKPKKVFIVTDSNAGGYYAGFLKATLEKQNIHAALYEVAPGEKSKSFFDFQAILEWMMEQGVNRQSYVIALGGGVVGDLAGFVAASALRGIKFIQIPTTLLSQVDSSVGGKTGINSKSGKNLIGAFYQPQSVAIDIDTLKTLPKREMLAGYAEIVKYGLLGDARFFKWLEENGSRVIEGETDALGHAIERSCAMKAEIVRQDEFEETGLRALLNLGHTFAHALETSCHYDGRLLHGEAVGIGLVLAARLSFEMGYISATEVKRVEKHLHTCGMMTEIRHIQPAINASAEDLLALMHKDKKATSKGLTFITLRKIGRAMVDTSVSEETVLKILKGSMQ